VIDPTMTAPILLLSDLHLPNTPSPLRTAFLAFLAGPARQAAAVYILGDLFEYWIGDAEGLREYAPEASALKALSSDGVTVYFMAGNRDFLVGKKFAAVAGLQLLPDPYRLDLGGIPTLLSHGDLFCTEDRAYQRWRRFSRNRVAQAIYRRLPESWRRYVAGAARGQPEGAARRNKPEAILDVVDADVRAAFAAYAVPRLIHGHTHRPARHTQQINGHNVERWVLADWRPGHYEYVVIDSDGFQRRNFLATGNTE
jgi:UDP-2,3-diacylglucosamine hydrolase